VATGGIGGVAGVDETHDAGAAANPVTEHACTVDETQYADVHSRLQNGEVVISVDDPVPGYTLQATAEHHGGYLA